MTTHIGWCAASAQGVFTEVQHLRPGDLLLWSRERGLAVVVWHRRSVAPDTFRIGVLFSEDYLYEWVVMAGSTVQVITREEADP